MRPNIDQEKALVESVGQLSTAVTRLTAALLEVQHHQFALIAALANQSQIDRQRFTQDFVSTLRMLEVDLERPSPVLEAILTLLKEPKEASQVLSIGRQLLLSSPHPPTTPESKEAPGKD